MDNTIIDYEEYLKGEGNEAPNKTADYPAPDSAVIPPPGDKIVKYLRGQFLKQTTYFQPGIRSINHDVTKP